MALTEHFIELFWVFKLIICRIQTKITTRGLKLAEFMCFKPIYSQILAYTASITILVDKSALISNSFFVKISFKK